MPKSGKKKQCGQSMVEYIAVVLGLIALWSVFDVVKDGLTQHHDKYVWTISQPL